MTEITYIPAEATELIKDVEENNVTSAMHHEESLLNQVDTGIGVGTVHVKKHIAGNNSKCLDVTSFPTDKYTYDEMIHHLQYEFGGGDYRIMVYGKKPGGKKSVCLENKLISIAEPKSFNTTSIDNKPVSDMSIILNAIKEQNQTLMHFMTQKDTQQNSRKEMLEEMMLYKNLFSNEITQTNPMSQFNEMANFLTTFGVKIGQEEKDKEDDSLTGLVREFMPAITEAVKKPVQNKPTNDAEAAKRKKMQKIINGLKMLVNAAKVGADPALYAEMIVQQFKEAEVKTFISGKNAVDIIKKLYPPAADYIEWFGHLSEHVKAQYGEDSKVSDLYEDEESGITAEKTGEVIDGEILSNGDT